jgi:hypothetical protein
MTGDGNIVPLADSPTHRSGVELFFSEKQLLCGTPWGIELMLT